MSKFEIELRGLLDAKQKTKLENFLSKHGKLIKKYKREHWIFGLSHSKTIDLRIKKTNGKYEFSLKVGKLANANRKEISIPIPEDKADHALEFLKFLGYREGLKAVRIGSVYQYKGVEWAVVEVPKHSFYFEAEKMVSGKKEGREAELAIRNVAESLRLKIFTKRETLKYIKRLDEEANKIFKLK